MLKLFFDGCSKGNGSKDCRSGCGWVLYNSENIEILNGNKYLGSFTNNEAEYSGLIEGLKMTLEYLKNQDQKDLIESLIPGNKFLLEINGDSKLVINHLLGLFKINAKNLIPLYKEVKTLVKEIEMYTKEVKYNHVYREFNKRADVLANLSLL